MAIICLFGFTIVSCEKDNKIDTEITIKNLVGDWVTTSVKEVYVEGGKLNEEEEEITLLWSLYTDMTYLENDNGYVYQGTWALQDDILFMYFGGVSSDVSKYVIQKLTTTELIVREPWYEGNSSGYEEYHFRRK